MASAVDMVDLIHPDRLDEEGSVASRYNRYCFKTFLICCSKMEFQTRGFLTAKETITEIRSRDGKCLAIDGSFLNEAIVDMLVT